MKHCTGVLGQPRHSPRLAVYDFNLFLQMMDVDNRINDENLSTSHYYV